MIFYDITVELHVTGSDRSKHFERVTDEYNALEAAHEGLLDSAWSFSNQDQHADVDVEVSVVAADEDAAYELALSSIRTAIHAAGGKTPDWGVRVKDAPAYRVTDESIELVNA